MAAALDLCFQTSDSSSPSYFEMGLLAAVADLEVWEPAADFVEVDWIVVGFVAGVVAAALTLLSNGWSCLIPSLNSNTTYRNHSISMHPIVASLRKLISASRQAH